jgi:hypothetical protein
MLMVPMVWAEIVGGDALGRGQEPALCWWLPDGASVQHAYRKAWTPVASRTIAEPLQQGRGGHVLAPLRRGTTAYVSRHHWTGAAPSG